MFTIKELLQEAVERKASDLHLTVGTPPTIRIHGELVRMDRPAMKPLDTDSLFREVSNENHRQRFDEKGEIDFSYAISGLGRFRVNVFRQRGSTGIVMRTINEEVPTLEKLNHPDVLKTMARHVRGLVLVTGPTGSGKSTTLAAMLNMINEERACHILTLEDPIEYLHKHKKSLVNQREINNDTHTFANALRAALREDPDVILVGEMRDAETIGIAVTAAETGHLVFATLHTGDAVQTIDRIIDVFPPGQQQQIRVQLSFTLQGIVSQQLLPLKDGTGRLAALEVFVVTPAARNIIREGKTHQLASVIQTGAKFGMQSMDSSLKNLYLKGKVDYEEAFSRAINQEMFTKLLNG